MFIKKDDSKPQLLTLANAIPGTLVRERATGDVGVLLAGLETEVPTQMDGPTGQYRSVPFMVSKKYKDGGGSRGVYAQPGKYEVLPEKLTPNALDMFYAAGLVDTMGSDPEFFVTDPKGRVIPAFKFLQPKTSSRSVFSDGFQGEMRFFDKPPYCLAMLGLYVNRELNIAAYHAKAAGGKLSIESVVEVASEDLLNATEQQIAFGCDPSLNVYGDKGEDVGNPRNFPLRFAGGHIHFGLKWNMAHKQHVIEEAVKALDATIGVACVSLFRKHDDARRRRYYGLAGEFRLPSHGLEYRTLSNAWLKNSRAYHLVFTVARQAFRFGASGWRGVLNAPESLVRQCINTCDVDLAVRILKENEFVWPYLLDYWTLAQAHGRDYALGTQAWKKTWHALLNGIDEHVNMEFSLANWRGTPNWANTVDA